MHMASIAIFEGRRLKDGNGNLRMDELRHLISGRLSLVPKLRQRPNGGFLNEAPPVWSDDAAFDITNHVVQRRAPAPGSEAELLHLCGDILSVPLSQDRPLWELTFIDGLQSGQIALVEKLHHSMADGIAAAELAMVLLDLTPEAPASEDPGAWRAQAPPSALYKASRDLRRLAEIPVRVLAWGGWTALHPVRRSRAWTAKATAMTSLLRTGLIAPPSPFNKQIGDAREVHVVRLNLDHVREVAHGHGATVNDVILTLVARGLHELLVTRGTLEEGAELQALVPVGLDVGPERGLGNRVSALFVRLPVGSDDPTATLRTVSSEARKHKEQHQELAADTFLRLLEPVPQSVIGGAAKLIRYQPFFNLIVTNVPGPAVPLFALGAKMVEAFPIVPLVGNQGMGVAALSYIGQINLGVFSDPTVCPDVRVFCEAARAALEDLEASSRRVRRRYDLPTFS
jgi:diacylglycerol O-acyltransferase / wax synthase